MIKQRVRSVKSYAKPFMAASCVVASGVLASGVALPMVRAAEMPAYSVDSAESSDSAVSSTHTSDQSGARSGQSGFADGVYLYGESPAPDQVGSAYLVFEVSESDRVVGAFYMPYSSFDCFQGEFQGTQLNLTVINAYTQTPHPYSIAVQSDTYVASNGNSAPAEVGLEGFHNLESISENDQRILATCKADVQ